MANAAINAALIAAAAQAQATSDAVLKQLRDAAAVRPGAAIKLDLAAKGSDAALNAFMKNGSVIDAGSGRYWLDEEAVARAKASANRAALILLAFLLSAGLSLIALLASR